MEKKHLADGTLLQGGKYKIVRFLNSGGFGCTYEALHTQFESRVAIKEFFIETFCNRNGNTGSVSIATDSQVEIVHKLRRKFVDEAKMVFQMHQKHPKKYHPNIVHVIDIFEENGTAYYVMDFIEGKSLNDMVKTCGPLPEQVALRYIRQVADALKYVHSFNRLHLDVKPGNIMIDANNDAILIDFGASKHYDEESGENTSSLLGINTKGYAPVEQQNASFKTFSPATDIYALGATIYKLLTGITPPDAASLLSEESFLQPLPTTISPNTRNAVNAAMQLKRKDRPQSIDEFLDILDGKITIKPKVVVVETDEATNLENVNNDVVKVEVVQAGIGNTVNNTSSTGNNVRDTGKKVDNGGDSANGSGNKKKTPQKSNGKEKKKSPLAVMAVALACAVVAAIIVYFALPKPNSDNKEQVAASGDTIIIGRPELVQDISSANEDASQQNSNIDVEENSLSITEPVKNSEEQESSVSNSTENNSNTQQTQASQQNTQQTQTNQQTTQQTQTGNIGTSTATLMNVQGNNNVVNNADFNVLGCTFREVNQSEKKQLNIKSGLVVVKVDNGAFKNSGISKDIILLKVNDEPMKTINDLQKAVKEASVSKNPILYIIGIYLTGKKSYYAVSLDTNT